MSRIVFVDIETSGLDKRRHEVWEVAAIVRDDDPENSPPPSRYCTRTMIDPLGYVEHTMVWQLPIRLHRADPTALSIGRYHQRKDIDLMVHPEEFAEEFMHMTWGAHIVGAIPSFDMERIERVLWKMGSVAGWHYHLICVESLMLGYLAWGRNVHDPAPDDSLFALPWKSSDLSAACGIERDKYPKHTALGDAEWARDVYDKIMGTPVTP